MVSTNSSRSRLTETTVKALTPKDTRYDIRDDVITGLVLRVAPTGRKTWCLSYRNPQGRQQRYTLGTWPGVKLDRARTLAKVELGKVAGGDDIQAEKKQERAKRTMPTLKQFVAGEYGDWIKEHHKGRLKTFHRLQSIIPWQDRPLDRITTKMVETLANEAPKRWYCPSHHRA